MVVSEEMLWKAFAASGDPVFYLLYRAAGTEAEKREEPARDDTAAD